MGNPESRCDHPDCRSTGLVLAPFRALRLDPRRVDVAAATSPPYDVIDDADIRELERGEARNVVRLTRPHGATDPYALAAATLASWRADGLLVQDERAGLYVVEQQQGDLRYRSLVGAVALRDPADGVVLPHEHVMPGPVADRLALLDATRTHLEPILLTTDDGHGAVQLAAKGCDENAPLLDIWVGSVRHRMWQVTDPATLAGVAAALRGVRALIADGHHRYTAALRLRDREHAAGRGHGPWDYALAYLVDTGSDPLELDGIHRSLAGVRSATLLAALEGIPGLRVEQVDRPHALAVLRETRSQNAGARFVVTDGQSWATVTDQTGALAARLPTGTPPGWERLDTALLHEVVLGELVPVPEDAIGYHHDLEPALRAAQAAAGCVVLLGAPTLREVIQLASAGVRVPRKTTSFGPKPRTGLVMRPLDDAVTAAGAH